MRATNPVRMRARRVARAVLNTDFTMISCPSRLSISHHCVVSTSRETKTDGEGNLLITIAAPPLCPPARFTTNARPMTIRPLSILLILLLGWGGVWGQILFSNDITDPNPSAYNPFTLGQTFDANINVSGIGRGSGIFAEASANRYNARSWNTMGIDLDAYFTFTLTPNSNYILNLNSFSYSGQASGTGPTNFAFRSSIDGYVGDIGSPIANGTTIDLSANQFQNITSSIEFRFYG